MQSVEGNQPSSAGFVSAIDGEVLTITLNRPERLNPQSPATWTALAQLARDLPGSIRVAVLNGLGRAFSAGLDRDAMPALAELGRADAEQAEQLIAGWQQAFDWISRPALVSVAAVHGHAIGAGFQLALAADIRIVSDDVQFSMAEPTLGLVPDLGGTKRLVDLVGTSRATELCLTGRRVGADEAYSMGLASRVVARDELDEAVAETVRALLAVPRDAATETKALLLAARTRTQGEQQAAERAAQHRLLRAMVDPDTT